MRFAMRHDRTIRQSSPRSRGRRLTRGDDSRRSTRSFGAAWPPSGSRGLRHADGGRLRRPLQPEKGAVDAIAIARRAGMAIDLYGDAYDGGYAEREVRAARHQPGVNVHPAVPRASSADHPGAGAVLCPVGWDEPFGLVAAEAQACATPVVAYRRGGLQDIIVDEVAGFLVAPGDSDGAASALCHATELDRTGCRRHAEAHLDIEAVLDAHERAYRDILTSALATTHG